ncbi:LpqN/LpqT family lipoprotein [Hoyosella subflava]|uniref:LpqN n=1 Tax=Hoyosella subflava (strain DSM 45089 / JCM 17490 / NBRC 109087 / DQS3-9A1) TaxID=443218 RepID=F6ES57_HOYSD|nr:LpqN/LpqT family lipoprotein [Hoyosella subflava]AEF42061.1 LpqN [Hoyosella subflava DQS3-9A1]
MTNRPLVRISGIAAAAIILGGCAADNGDTPDGSPPAPPTTVAVSVPPAAAATTTEAADTVEPEPAYSIADYLAENGIGRTPLAAGTETGPAVEFDLPSGWELAAPGMFPQSYVAAVGTQWESEHDPGPLPAAVLTVLRLDRIVDPEDLLEHAGGAVANLPGFEIAVDDPDSEISGLPSYALSGEYLDDEAGYIAIVERTVIAEDDDASYVIQLRVTARSHDAEAVTDSVQEIDGSLTVTPRTEE